MENTKDTSKKTNQKTVTQTPQKPNQKPAVRNKVKGTDMPIVWNEKYILIKKNALIGNNGEKENLSTLWTSIFEIPYMMVNGVPRPSSQIVPDEIWNKEVEKLSEAVLKLKRKTKPKEKSNNLKQENARNKS